MLFFKNKISLFIDIQAGNWDGKIKNLQKYAEKVINTCFKIVGCKILKGMEINLILTDDKNIQEINKKYRKKDKATNVISFETGDELLLGDIFMSYDTLIREAYEQNLSFIDHFTHLLCHGVLHILGYDHIIDTDAEIMENLEIKILQKFKIRNPYE